METFATLMKNKARDEKIYNIIRQIEYVYRSVCLITGNEQIYQEAVLIAHPYKHSPVVGWLYERWVTAKAIKEVANLRAIDEWSDIRTEIVGCGIYPGSVHFRRIAYNRSGQTRIATYLWPIEWGAEEFYSGEIIESEIKKLEEVIRE